MKNSALSLGLVLSLASAAAQALPPRQAQAQDFRLVVQGHRAIHRLAFTPDSQFLISASDDGQLNLWNSEGLLLRTFGGGTGSVTGVAGAPDGRIASWGSGPIRLWDNEGSLAQTLEVAQRPVVLGLAFSPDGRHLAAGYSDGRLRVWNTQGAIIRTLEAAPGAVNAVAYSPDGKHIASASSDGTLRLWGAGGALQRVFSGHSGAANSVAFSSDGKKLVSGSSDGTIRLWGTGGACLRVIPNSPLGAPRGPAGQRFPDPAAKPLAVRAAGFRGGQLYSISLDGIKVWDDTGNLAQSSRWPVASEAAAAFSPDGKYFAYRAAHTGDFLFQDADSGFVRSFSRRELKPAEAAFTPDGRHILAGSLLFGLEGNLIAAFTSPALQLTRDGKHIIAARGSSAVVFDIAAQRPRAELATRAVALALAADDRHFASADDSAVKLWTLGGDLVRTFSGARGLIRGVALSPDGKHLAAGSTISSGEKLVTLWTMNGALVRAFPVRTLLGMDKLAFTPDGGRIVAGDEAWGLDGSFAAHLPWGPANPAWTKRYTGPAATPDGKYSLAAGPDALKLTNNLNGQYFNIVSDGTDWLVYSPDGYYDASARGGRFLAMVRGTEAYGIEHFAARNNRPDLILERMGLGSSEEIAYYQLLYQKRLEKLGLKEADLSAGRPIPLARISGLKREGKFLDLSFSLAGAGAPLSRYDVSVNGVPLFGSSGRKLSGGSFSGTERIELSPGVNRIEVSVLDQAGGESLRALSFAEYRGGGKGDLYFLGFGASKYKDPGLDLNYADKDMRDLAAAVSKMAPAYAGVHTRLYLNSDVTADNIVKAGEFLKDAKPDDTVLLAIAGHGGYSRGADPKYYFLAYNSVPADLPGTGVAFDKLEGLLDGIRPRKKLFLMDTCESGELEDEVFEAFWSQAGARGLTPRAPRAARTALAGGRGRGYLHGRDRLIFSGLARRTGAVIFSSSRGGEISYESSELRNGFFTREILNALAGGSADLNGDGQLDSGELRDYVSGAVARETGGLQHPGIDRDNPYQKISLPLLEGK